MNHTTIAGLMVALASTLLACGSSPNDNDTDGVAASESATSAQTLLFDKKDWGKTGSAYDTTFFNKADADPEVKGWRVVGWDSEDGSYQEQYITRSTGWGDLALHRPQIAASAGQWWQNIIEGKVGPEATIFVEGKIYFMDSAGQVLYECVSVTNSTSWAQGELQTWNVKSGVKPKTNAARSACQAPKGTVELRMHIKSTAKAADKEGAGYVREWKVGRCANDGECNF
jgi:hypothetical protein